MSIFEKHRFKIFNQGQHPYKHELGDFSYTNPKLPGALTLGDALDYMISILYPNFIAEVANQAALPASGNIGDYYVVTDDGDGKRAGYIWQSVDGAPQWFKRFDVDWSTEGLLASTFNVVDFRFVHKYGTQDRDESGTLLAGDLAGQRIYGGNTAGEHLILYANSGDAAGNTGYIQAGDDVRPLVDSSFTLGTTTYRWSNFFSDLATVSTMSLAGGSITDSTGAISFDNEDLTTTGSFTCGALTINGSFSLSTLVLAGGSITDTTGSISFENENLTTTGTLASGTHTVSSTLILGSGSITDTTGNISFDNENLLTTGTFGCGTLTTTQLNVDDIRIDGSTITSTLVNGSINLLATGSGKIDLQSYTTATSISATGNITAENTLVGGNIQIFGNQIVSSNTNGSITIHPDGTGSLEVLSSIHPSIESGVHDLGKTASFWNDIWFTGDLKANGKTFTNADLFSLRNANFRDSARTQAVQDGDTLFWNAATSTWLASHPDSEIDHSELTGLTTTDAGHTQFAMLAGRAGGQTVQGGTAASENLILESTANATKGDIFTKDDFCPFTNASYAAGWSGTDLGDATHYFRDIYTKGQAKGLRAENYTFAGLPGSSASSVGRLLYTTDTGDLYTDTGTAIKRVGNVHKHIEDLVYNGTDLIKNVDVSANITDARNAIKQLFDNTNNFELLNVTIEATSASNVRITTNVALPAGSYRLIVME